MRIAGAVREARQFAKDSRIDVGAQGGFHLGHGEGVPALEQVYQRLPEESDGSHNARITPFPILASVILT
jgi:hypothetical protein